MSATTAVVTPAGRLEGLRSGGASTWRGIPYAEPPVGPLRFREPRPARPWSGVRPAVFSGGAATQPHRRAAAAGLGSSVGEDCLYLDVTTPAAPATDGSARPVLVWIHGGAFTTGSGALYDGRHLAVRGDLVVVTINYRLGVFGFADLAGVAGEDVPSNLGLRDVVAALEWVRDTIARFGGDPERVTVAGESAGSMIIALLTAAPAAAGLFRAAICQSGAATLTHGEGVRAQVARAYARELGLRPGGPVRLRELPAAQLLAAQQATGAAIHATTAAAPWFDGDVVPVSLDAARAAVRPDLALLAGSTRDEILFFTRMRTDVLHTRRADVAERLREGLGAAAAASVLAAYPSTRAGDAQLATDLNFAMPTATFAERHAGAGGTTYAYRFDAATPWLGACHASDLVPLWNWSGPAATLLRGPSTRPRRALADRMQRHWASFVRSGAPEQGWPAYELPERATLVLDSAGDHVEADPFGQRRRAWAGADVAPYR